ncbi:MAG: hypothetical protein ACFE0O_04265 [Opitutales bacterium]
MTHDPIHIEFWTPDGAQLGRHGAPQRWVNILGRVTARHGLHDVRARVPDLRFWKPLSTGPTAYRLAGGGDFNFEIERRDLPIGKPIEVFIDASDKRGNEVSQSITVTRAEPSATELTDVGFELSGRWDPEAYEIVDGLWEATDDGLTTVEPGYDRCIGLGDMNWRDYRVEVDVTWHSFSKDPIHAILPSNGAWAGVVCYFTGHVDWQEQFPRRGWYPYGVIANLDTSPDLRPARLRLMGNMFKPIQVDDESDRVFDPQTRYTLVAEARSNPGGQMNRYRMKVFPAGEPEPDGWDLAGLGLEGELNWGAPLLVAHQARVTYHRVRVTPLKE